MLIPHVLICSAVVVGSNHGDDLLIFMLKLDSEIGNFSDGEFVVSHGDQLVFGALASLIIQFAILECHDPGSIVPCIGLHLAHC